jgi:hypothetical protein
MAVDVPKGFTIAVPIREFRAQSSFPARRIRLDQNGMGLSNTRLTFNLATRTPQTVTGVHFTRASAGELPLQQHSADVADTVDKFMNLGKQNSTSRSQV